MAVTAWSAARSAGTRRAIFEQAPPLLRSIVSSMSVIRGPSRKRKSQMQILRERLSFAAADRIKAACERIFGSSESRRPRGCQQETLSMLRFWSTLFVTIVFAAIAPCRAQSAPQTHWVGTWATSPVSAEGVNIRLFSGATMREIAHISLGGDQIRLRFTNEFGLDPLTLSDVHVALSAGGGAIQPASDHAVTFGGASSVSISPGAAIYSDPVAITVAPLADVAVSFYLPPQIMRAETYHAAAHQDNYLADGHAPAAAQLPQPAVLPSWYFFDGVDVAAAPDSRAVITFGDSITDG